MRWLTTVVVAVLLAVTVTGFSVMFVASPWVVAQLSSRYSLAAQARLTADQAARYAETTRAFVADPRPASDLPLDPEGRVGFDQDAVSHLRDVRRVIEFGRLATGIAAGLLAVWVAVQLVRRRYDDITLGLRAGAVACFLVVVLAAFAGLLDFDALFTWFHGLFFAEGTWTFPVDSLLIRLFPLHFWMTAAGLWALLIAVGGGLLLVAASLVRSTGQRRAALADRDVPA